VTAHFVVLPQQLDIAANSVSEVPLRSGERRIWVAKLTVFEISPVRSRSVQISIARIDHLGGTDL